MCIAEYDEKKTLAQERADGEEDCAEERERLLIRMREQGYTEEQRKKIFSDDDLSAWIEAEKIADDSKSPSFDNVEDLVEELLSE